ncbi:hypothetical protein K438DRAFT_2058946 [Mycena galopus ATCC 62051]|nr:hypothetical protein K438DRAFT_2058946 [Mycena galopus ATCC 62051]
MLERREAGADGVCDARAFVPEDEHRERTLGGSDDAFGMTARGTQGRVSIYAARPLLASRYLWCPFVRCQILSSRVRVCANTTNEHIFRRLPWNQRSAADQSQRCRPLGFPERLGLLGAGRDRAQARPNPNQALQTSSANSGLHAKIAIVRVTADGVLKLSCFNTPASIAVSGTAAALDEAIALSNSEGFFAPRIRTMVPGHSSFMDPIKDVDLAKINDNFSRYPESHALKIPVFSTCKDEPFIETFSSSYFWDNCRNSVLFSDAVSAVLEQCCVLCTIEISAKRA